MVVRDLMETDLPFVNAPWLQAYFTPPEQYSDEMKQVLRLSDELVAELLATDHLLIATPVYNYNVPAALKAWIDHVVRKGLTLGMDGNGVVTGKKAMVLMASGGVYTEGSPIRGRDIATRHLKVCPERKRFLGAGCGRAPGVSFLSDVDTRESPAVRPQQASLSQ